MSARLIILVIVAGGLAVYFAARAKTPPTDVEEADVMFMGADGQTLKDVRAESTLVGAQPISGVEPDDPPEFHVQVEVDTSGGKHRLYLYISEEHGYYADDFHVQVWRKGAGVTGPDDSPLSVPVMVNDFLKANETLRACTELTPLEMKSINGDIGTSGDWAAYVEQYGRVRAENPEPLPRAPQSTTCDG